MIKKIVPFIVLSGLAVTGCNKVDVTLIDREAQVSVHVSNLSATLDEFPSTRATQGIADYDNVKAVTLAFFTPDGTQAFSATQLKDDASTYTTFGDFSCTLPIGTYTVVAIGRGYYDGDILTLTGPTLAAYTSERPRETFAATTTLPLTSTDPAELSMTLNRIIAKVEIYSTDERPANVMRYRTTYSAGAKSFNPTTGLATANDGFSVTNSVGSVGQTAYFTSYVFLTSDEQAMNVTIECLDADDNVISTVTAHDVPLKRNRITRLTGRLFSATASASSIQLETEWLQNANVAL